MTKIIIGTTPTITYRFKVVDVTDITVAIITIKERGVNIVELNLSDATIGEDSLSWTLTQEETLQLAGKTAKRSERRGIYSRRSEPHKRGDLI